MTTAKVTVASVQMASGDWDLQKNIDRADRLIREAAGKGAQIILCPELFMMPYFCIDQNAAHFAHALPADNHPGLQHFAALAKELSVVIPVGFFEKAGYAYFNSIAIMDADGSCLGVYRKTHIPDGPGYTEKYYFTPGDTGFKVWQTRYAKLGVGICWDQWYPETARSMALMGAEILCFPTIIGSEPQNDQLDSAPHWQRTMQGHAAANMMPLIAANRIGAETGIGNANGSQAAFTNVFYGSSFIADHTGAKVAEANRTDESILIASFDLAEVAKARASFGFFRDRRPAMYGTVLTSDGKNQTV